MTGVDDNWQQGERDYRAFLLRCWKENELQNEGEPADLCGWRFALVQVNEEREQGFACLDELLTFLSHEFANTGSPVTSGVEE